MEITKNDFLDWKSHIVTKEVFATIEQKIEDAVEALVVSTESNPDRDMFLRGMISAFKDVLEISYEGEE